MAEPDEDHVIEEPTPLPLWQEIQKRTFTNWVNLRLSPSFINDLFVDMSDGLQLIKLIEVLTERSLGRRNKRIEHVNQRLDNVAIALDFLQDKEGINLTNIGPSDVVERNPKLILGLMWILFRHYTIAKALPQLPHELGQKTNDKARLLQWIRSKLPASFPVSNLTSDWNDGFALAALVEGCVPGLKVGWKNWDPTTPLENTKKAMDLAHEHLGIDRMIAPEDLISSDVDEISVMAYLTNFPLMVEAKKTRGTLSNIDRHPIAGIRSAFNIRIVNPNHIPKINISKPGTSTQDSSVPVEITPTNDPHVFDVSYIPPIPGPYDISLHVTNPEEPDEKRPSDAVLKVEAVEGPGLKGLNPHSFVGEPQHLKIYNCNPQDNVRVEIIGPESSRNLIPMQWNHVNREFEGTFKPEKPGHHSVNVLCNSRSIKGSPFPTRVQELPVPEFWGRGICESLRAGEEAIVCAEYPSHISASDAQRYLKNAKLVVSSNNQEVPIKEKIDGNVKTFSYIPEDVAVHEVKTYFNDKLIGKHLVNAQYPSALSRAFGPGTEVGMENQKATFVIDRAKNEEVQFAVEGPAPSELRRNDIDDNTAIIEYTPTAPGKYYVSVLDNHGQNVKDSPFAVNVKDEVQGFYPGNAKISKLPPIVRVNEVVEFTADTRPAHSIVPTPDLYVYDPESEKIETRVQQKSDGTFKCSFCPRIVGHHQVFVAVDGVSVPPCPVKVTCVDPDKIQYSGPGIDSPLYCSPNQTHFVIDAKQAGPGNVEVEMFTGEEHQKVDVEVVDENDGSYTVKYCAPKAGAYNIKVVFAGYTLPSFEINVQQPANASGAIIEGLDNAIVTVNTEKEVHVFTSNGENFRIVIKSPSGQLIEAFIESTPKGFCFKFTPSEIGDYSIDVTYEDYPISDSPFFLHSIPPLKDLNSAESQYFAQTSGPPNANMVRVGGPGLGPIVSTGQSTSILIDATKAGFGNIDVFVDGPTRTPIHCIDNEDGTCSMQYVPCVSGIYWIRILFDDKNVPGSPFQVFASPKDDEKSGIKNSIKDKRASTQRETFENEYDNKVTDASKCVATGEGLYESTVGEISEFKVDTTEAGPGDLSFSIDGPNSSTTIVDYTPGSCTAIYSPTHPGIYKISALFGNSDENREHIPGSPFTMVADYPRDPSTIAVYDDSTDSTSTKKVPLGVPQSFIVDASKTAKDEISLDPDSLGKRDEYNVTEIEPRIWKIEYLLNSPAGRTVPLDIRYGDELLAIGPVAEVVDYLADNLKVNKISPARINSLETNIEIDVKDVGKIERVTAKIEDLNGNGELTNAIVIKKDNGLHEIIANPEKAGTYGLMVFADSHLLNKKPIEFKAVKDGVSKDCHIINSPKEWIINKPNDILLQHHGDDNKIVDVLQEKDQENLKYESFTANATDLYENSHPDDKLVIVRLTPEKIQQYDRQILYDSQPVKNGTFSFVPEEKSEKLVKNKDAEIDENRSYNFALGKENAEKEIVAFALDSDKHLIPLEVNHIDDDGNARVNAHFSKSGQHVIFLFADRELLPKHVIKEVLNKEEANAFGKGLETATVGETSSFDIVCPDRGQVKVNVKGPKSVKIQMEQKMENSCTVHWTPEVAGNYEVLIYLNKSEIPAAGSPFIVKALPSTKTSKSRKSSCFSYSAPSEVTFDCGKVVTKENLTATVRSPDGKVSQCGVRLIGDNRIGLSMKPKIVGDYEFKILEKGQEMPHSPFFVKVKNVDLPDPKKVKIFGNGLHHAVAGQDNEFFIDCQGAGYGSVLAAIDGPADAPMSCVRTRDKMLRILYRPPVTGTYHITVKFDDKIVPGSPYIVECHESDKKEYNSQKTRSPITLNKIGERGQTDSKRKAEIHLYIPNSDASRLEANISDPLGQKYSGIVTSLGRDYYSIQLKPVEHGKYFVHVTQDGKDIQGSRFSFSAGQKESSQADKVKVGGTGLEYGQTGQPQSFMIYTTQAGPGLVSAVIDGPEKPFTKLKDLRDGRVSVEYTANTPGHYFINVLFNGTPIRSTPYCVYIAPGKTSSKKRQNGVKPIAQPPYIETSQEKSPPPPSSPKSKEIREIKESKDLAHLDIRGLSHIMTGKSTDFEIIPTYQGESTFSIEVYGPSKVKLNTETTKEGIKVKFTPYAPGEYIITVKNNGINVGESPKKVRVEGHKLGGEGINESSVIYARYISHTSTTVTKYGNNNVEEKPYQEIIQQQQIENRAQDLVIDGFGISQFSPGKAAMFRINNIGNKTLFVGVVTAMGPCQQCSVNNCGNGSFLVSYIISDRSPGFIYIRYGDEDVPGSPFQTLPTSR